MSNQLTIHKNGETKRVEFSWDRSNRFRFEEQVDLDMPECYIIIQYFMCCLVP